MVGNDTFWDKVTLNNEEFKPVALAIIELWSECIKKFVRQQKILKLYNISLVKGFRVDQKTFLSLAMPKLPRCHNKH